MTVQMTLKIDSPLVSANAVNYRLPAWPPPDDFPITMDLDGRVVSRYREQVWDFTAYAGRVTKINFGDCQTRNGLSAISSGNERLYRQVVAWWMFGDRHLTKARSLYSYAVRIRTVFVLCTEAGILASDLMRFPKVVDQLAHTLKSSQSESVFNELHALFASREQLGFTILDREGLRRLEASLPPHQRRQTPYIPPRIWLHQVGRLRTFLEDFHAHRTGIEACYRFCVEAYLENHRSSVELSTSQSDHRNPFAKCTQDGKSARYRGTFTETAQRFGISELLSRWCLAPGRYLDKLSKVSLLGNYMSQVGFVGTAYLLNFSGMRSDECRSLRSDCLQIEDDEHLGKIHLLKGETTKTVEDDDALWVTSPSVVIAVSAMASVAQLRMEAAVANPTIAAASEDLDNPYLMSWAFEPWTPSNIPKQPTKVRPSSNAYAAWRVVTPNLFDAAELRVSDTDLQLAQLINPTLDSRRFAVGQEWPLAWHQLRRTTTVNMAASGLVSDPSLQYQLKHLSRSMSLYYGQGYSRRHLSEDARTEYIRGIYEMLGHQIARLFDDRFVSPLGDAHKENLLKVIDLTDHKSLQEKAKKGHISYRATLLGGCLKKGSCPYGGIDNVAHCGGGAGSAPCPDALFDKEKLESIKALRHVIAMRLLEAPAGSPMRESLEAQHQSVEVALDVLSY